MEHDITYYAQKRHTVKTYDANKKIPAAQIEQVKSLLRFSPSSTNAQPWHFILASTDEGKNRIAKSTEQKYPFNKNAILDASHVVVFCSKLDIEDDYLARVLNQEKLDGRFKSDPKALSARMDAGRKIFINIHKHDYKDVQHWMDKQVYLNIGNFLLGVSALGIGATPMEGIDTKVLDEEFNLREQGYSSLVVIPLGYHDTQKDYNANLPKSRLPLDEILTEV